MSDDDLRALERIVAARPDDKTTRCETTAQVDEIVVSGDRAAVTLYHRAVGIFEVTDHHFGEELGRSRANDRDEHVWSWVLGDRVLVHHLAQRGFEVLSLADGSRLWRRRSDLKPDGLVGCSDEDGLVFSHDRGEICELDSRSLEVRWRLVSRGLGTALGAKVFVFEDYDDAGGMRTCALERATGRILWKWDRPPCHQAIAENVLFSAWRPHGAEDRAMVAAKDIETGASIFELAIEIPAPGTYTGVSILPLDRKLVLVAGLKDGKTTLVVLED